MAGVRDGGRIDAVPHPALELLRLLAEDTESAELEAVARELAAEDAEVGAAARDLALQVRAGIDASRRRTSELTALIDTARELASRHDPAGVLDAIVRRARALLGTDVAYLTLFDPKRGDTFMRATDGSASARFQAVRLPTGAGLGGLVAQTRRPYATADYLADTRFQHTTDIDGAVADEGLVAICGTPLLVDGEFVGVLFAANRSRRPASSRELALLGSLAALAAVSLVQAQRAAETAEALSALSEAHAGIRKAAEAHDRFAQIVLEGGGVDDIAAALGELLQAWVVVLDVDGRRIATHGSAPPSPAPDPLAATAAARSSETTGRLAGEDGVWAVVIRASGQRLGTLVLGGPAKIDAGEGRTVERAALVTALVLLFRRQAAESEARVRTALLADLLALPVGGAEGDALAERGRLLGVALHEPHVLAVCVADAGRRRSLVSAASTAVGSRGLACEHVGEVVVLLPGEDPSAAARMLAGRLSAVGDGTPVTVGAAGPTVPAGGVQATHAEARRTLDALLALDTPARGAAAADLGFAGLVVGGSPDVAGYLRRELGPVLDYDERHGSDLVGTLEAYFAAASSPRRAAQVLHLHVNTVGQRLDRVARLLGEDWRTPQRALELQLALRLRHLRGR